MGGRARWWAVERLQFEIGDWADAVLAMPDAPTHPLIPIVGAIWVLIELGLRRGTLGDNQYGEDPLERNAGYFTVDIGHP